MFIQIHSPRPGTKMVGRNGGKLRWGRVSGRRTNIFGGRIGGRANRSGPARWRWVDNYMGWAREQKQWCRRHCARMYFFGNTILYNPCPFNYIHTVYVTTDCHIVPRPEPIDIVIGFLVIVIHHNRIWCPPPHYIDYCEIQKSCFRKLYFHNCFCRSFQQPPCDHFPLQVISNHKQPNFHGQHQYSYQFVCH